MHSSYKESLKILLPGLTSLTIRLLTSIRINLITDWYNPIAEAMSISPVTRRAR
jgi:hypothetical protein